MASKIPIFGGIAAAVGITVFVLFFTPAGISQEEYSLSVDPTREKQSLFIMARVSLENTGSKPLTNVELNFGDGDKNISWNIKTWTIRNYFSSSR